MDITVQMVWEPLRLPSGPPEEFIICVEASLDENGNKVHLTQWEEVEVLNRARHGEDETGC